MKKILMSLILLMTISVVFGQNRKRESYYQNKFAKIIGGESEVRLEDGTRADIVTEDYAIEVDFAEKWKDGIGQSLHYGMMLDKIPAIVLVIANDEKHYVEALLTNIGYYRLPVVVWVWYWEDDTWSKVDIEIKYFY